MKILVIGSGGREHALVWRLAQSPRAGKIYCAPGNAGIAEQAQCVPVSAEDIGSLLSFAEKERIDLTVVGPEGPLTTGIVDTFTQRGLKIFGPAKKAAALEGSKVFSKDLLAKYGIPCGESRTFTDYKTAVEYVRRAALPVVVKADGLAAGKGVIIARKVEEALDALDLIMVKKNFGTAGDRVLIEEFLEGEEASFLAFTDGETVLPMPSCQDHKAVYDGDRGPNTGGMGAYSPAPVVTPEIHRRVMEEIMNPVVQAMAAEGRRYQGVLYAGLMIKNGNPKVLEFNARFGDPETQPLLMRLKTDLVSVLQATIDGRLRDIKLEWDSRATVCVVLASGGYPGPYEKGKEIFGLADAARVPDTFIFHAGTSMRDGKVVTSGGRVLGVTALGAGIREAIDRAYEAAGKISWEGVHFRRDIGQKALNRKGRE